MKAGNFVKKGLAGILCTALIVGIPNQARAPTKDYETLPIELNYNSVEAKSFLDKKEKDFVKKLELIVSVERSKKFVDDYYKMNPNTSFEKEYILATIFGESRGDIFACSEDSALSLMQNTKRSWEWIEPKKDFEKYACDPISSIDVGVKLLSWFENYCEKKCPTWDKMDSVEKMKLVSACYNTGQEKVKKRGWDIDKTNSDTKKYIHKDVFWAYNELKNDSYIKYASQLYSWAYKTLTDKNIIKKSS